MSASIEISARHARWPAIHRRIRVRRLVKLLLRLGHATEGPLLALTPGGVSSRPATGVIRIGRDPDSDMVVDDLMASRRHAELRPTATGFEIADLGSQNGTFVNGVRVTTAPVQVAAKKERGKRRSIREYLRRRHSTWILPQHLKLIWSYTWSH